MLEQEHRLKSIYNLLALYFSLSTSISVQKFWEWNPKSVENLEVLGIESETFGFLEVLGTESYFWGK